MSKQGYIFLCNDTTEAECLKKLLFGGGEPYQKKTGNLQKGDILFLYNLQSQHLHGIFRASSDPNLNIVPDAWKGEFPWQVKVKRLVQYKPLPRSQIEHLLKFGRNGFPPAKVGVEQIERLTKAFKSDHRVSIEEKDYRRENPPRICTNDGHWVRSKGEEIVDNWLFEHNLPHGYEISVPDTQGTMYCDFFIENPKTNQRIYIEFWGLEDKKYKQRRKEKISLYKKYNLALIELFPEDLGDIDIIMKRKLQPFFNFSSLR